MYKTKEHFYFTSQTSLLIESKKLFKRCFKTLFSFQMSIAVDKEEKFDFFFVSNLCVMCDS